VKPKRTALESIRELGPYPFELDPPLRTLEDLDRVTEEFAKIEAGERKRRALN
jgi:hypothetical protein